jgi:hypothetical protein
VWRGDSVFHAPCLEEVGKEVGGKLRSSIRPEKIGSGCAAKVVTEGTNEPWSSGVLAHLYYVGPISLAVDEDKELLTTI